MHIGNADTKPELDKCEPQKENGQAKTTIFWWLVSKLLKLICTATIVVIVSGVQLRLRSTIRHHPPQRAVLRQICCFEIVRWCCFRSCCTVLSHVMRGRPGCLLQSAGEEVNRILLASALSSMRIICPNRVSRCDRIIAVSLGCFVSLRTLSFWTNWYHMMPSSIRRHHWSSASILRASVFDITQQSEPYRNIDMMHVLYSFSFIAVASRDRQIWFSRLRMAARVMALWRLM